MLDLRDHRLWGGLAVAFIAAVFLLAVAEEVVFAPPSRVTPSVGIAFETAPAAPPSDAPTMDDLLRAAADADPLRRAEAVRSLGARPEAAARLVAALDDADQRVREAAARALLERPDGPRWAAGRPPATPEGLGDLLRVARERPDLALSMPETVRRALLSPPPARSEAMNLLARLPAASRAVWRREIEALARGDGDDPVTLKALEFLEEMGP